MLPAVQGRGPPVEVQLDASPPRLQLRQGLGQGGEHPQDEHRVQDSHRQHQYDACGGGQVVNGAHVCRGVQRGHCEEVGRPQRDDLRALIQSARHITSCNYSNQTLEHLGAVFKALQVAVWKWPCAQPIHMRAHVLAKKSKRIAHLVLDGAQVWQDDAKTHGHDEN